MASSIDHIAKLLRQAREQKGLSQRRLSTASGMPQSHISKIENGAVDLRVSSLVELARTLDLELTLVPRRAVAAVRAVVRASERPDAPEPARPAYSLDDDESADA